MTIHIFPNSDSKLIHADTIPFSVEDTVRNPEAISRQYWETRRLGVYSVSNTNARTSMDSR